MIPLLVKDTHAEYLASTAIGRGRIVSEIQHSPKKAKHDEDNGTPTTDPMRVGSAGHAAVFEPDLFDANWRAFDGRRSTQGGEPSGKWADFLNDCGVPRDNVIRPDEYRYCLELRAALRTSRKFQALMDCTVVEHSLYWNGLKARFDAYKRGCVIDLKTTRDISDDGIERALNASNMIQIAHYVEGAAAHEGRPFDWTTIEDAGDIPSFIFVFVSKEQPIEVRLVEVPFEHVKQAAMVRHVALERIRSNREAKTFPSYPDTVESFSPKPYIFS